MTGIIIALGVGCLGCGIAVLAIGGGVYYDAAAVMQIALGTAALLLVLALRERPTR